MQGHLNHLHPAIHRTSHPPPPSVDLFVLPNFPQGHLHKALESLLNLEKSSRLAEDVTATKAACAAILEVAFEAKEWKLLEENILLLAKRRSQLKQVGESSSKIAVGCCPPTALTHNWFCPGNHSCLTLDRREGCEA